MNTREIAAEYRLQHWAQIIHEKNESGSSAREFCKNVGIHESVYFYWQRKLREAACEQLTDNKRGASPAGIIPSGFTEVRLSGPSKRAAHTCPGNFAGTATSGCLCIEIGGVRITADNAYNPANLAELLRGIAPLC